MFQIFCADSWPLTEYTDPETGRLVVRTYYRTTYYVLVSMVMFFVPMTVVTLAYSAIVYRLWSTESSPRDGPVLEFDPRCTSLRVHVKKKARPLSTS